MQKKFHVRLYYSGYIGVEVYAKTEDEALIKARKSDIDVEEILPTLERWPDADEVE